MVFFVRALFGFLAQFDFVLKKCQLETIKLTRGMILSIRRWHGCLFVLLLNFVIYKLSELCTCVF